MKRIVLLYAALAVAALAYTGYWFLLAARAEQAIDREIAGLAARGLAVSYTGRRLTGYPYRLSAEFTGLALGPSGGAPGGRSDWRWESDRVAAHVEPWNLRHVVAVFDGAHRLQTARGASIPATAESARASLVLDDTGRPLRAVVDAADIEFAAAAGFPGAEAERVRLAARRATGAGEEAARADVDVAVRIDGLSVAEEGRAVVAHPVRRMSAEGTLRGPPPAAWTPAEIARWRDGGGAFAVRDVAFEWGPVSLHGDGEIGLDEALRPRGGIDARIAGFPALVDLLRDEGVIDDGVALALTLALGLLAETPDGGGAPRVAVPITLGEGRLRIGPVPVLRIGAVAGLSSAPRR